jgi:hypothetical protein
MRQNGEGGCQGKVRSKTRPFVALQRIKKGLGGGVGSERQRKEAPESTS